MPSALVVGGGITGLGAAALLRARGWRCELVEARDDTGGLLRPVPFRGLACDRGSHRVHDDADAVLFQLAPHLRWDRRPRRGALVLGDRRARYPFTPASLARSLGLGAAAAMGLSWLRRPRAVDGGDDDEGFEAYVRARVGDLAWSRLYAPYAEKVWGLPPDALSRTVGQQRLATAAPLALVARALRGRADGYVYPREGLGAVVEALRQRCERGGVRVTVGRALDAAALDASDHDAVVYAAPLRHLAPDGGFEHRGLYLVHLAVAPDAVDDTDTWYVPDPRWWFGRVSQPARFAAGGEGAREAVLAVEIPEGRWGPGVDFVARLDELRAQLVDAGILRRGAAVREAAQTWVPDVYPLYRRGWTSRWRAAVRAVAARGRCFPAGRQGLWLHCNLDHALGTARDLVDHLARGGDARAWAARCEAYLGLRVRD